MNDILVKPFTKKDIAPLLEKWMTDGGEAQPVQELEPADETAAPTGEQTATHAESTYIFDFDSAVENFMGKKETVKKVVGRFIDKVENQFPTIEEALDRKDLETVRSEAHSIKGGAWNLAVKKLGDTAKNLEDSSREEKQEDSRNNFEQLKDAYQEFRRFVDPLLEEE
jgi:HPt (histidine-containing phosphotransfer) domain-containing protein